MDWHRIIRDMTRGKTPERAWADEMDRRRDAQAPTRAYALDDVLEVWHKQAKIAIVVVDGRMRDRSLVVHEGETPGKITFVSANETRLYLEVGPNRQKVFRGVTLKLTGRRGVRGSK